MATEEKTHFALLTGLFVSRATWVPRRRQTAPEPCSSWTPPAFSCPCRTLFALRTLFGVFQQVFFSSTLQAQPWMHCGVWGTHLGGNFRSPDESQGKQENESQPQVPEADRRKSRFSVRGNGSEEYRTVAEPYTNLRREEAGEAEVTPTTCLFKKKARNDGGVA